jgi:hypothetical protein
LRNFTSRYPTFHRVAKNPSRGHFADATPFLMSVSWTEV